MLFEFGDNSFETLFKIAAITRSGENRAHVERENFRVLQNVRHFAFVNFERETFRQAVLPTPGSPT